MFEKKLETFIEIYGIGKVHSFDNEEKSVKLTSEYSVIYKILQNILASNVLAAIYKSSLFAHLLMHRNIKCLKSIRN